MNIPEFKLKSINGKTYTNNDFQTNQCFLVLFGCNHCPYVIANFGRIKNIYDTFKEKDFAMVMINSNDPIKYPQDSFENMQKTAKDLDFQFSYLFDETQDIARAFGAQRTPEAFLFSNGKLVYHGAIDDSCKDENAVTIKYLENAILKTLAGHDVDIKDAAPVGCSVKWK